MLDDVTTSVRETMGKLDSVTRLRLDPCLPMLSETLQNWQATAPQSCDPLLIVAASPISGVIIGAEDWPDLDQAVIAKLELADVVWTITRGLERKPPTGDTIFGAVAVVMGTEGIAAQQRDGAETLENGDTPLVVFLTARHGKNKFHVRHNDRHQDRPQRYAST